MTEFDDALTITNGRAELGEGWIVGQAVNGGVLMALATRAATEALAAHDPAPAHIDPVAFTTTFLTAAQPGPAEVTAEVLRAGRSFSTVAVTIGQTGRTCLTHTTTFGDLDAQSEPVHRAAEPPSMPDPEDCIRAERKGFGAPITLLDRLDLRIDPATAGWAEGRPARDGELRAWVRFADGREPDTASLPFFLDALPPVSVTLGAEGWAPTLSFSGHVRGRPAPGWLRIRLTTSNVIGGLFEEDATIWDSRDRVVAQSRQLAGVRMPAAPGASSTAPRAGMPAAPGASSARPSDPSQPDGNA
ncbi:thioesterase superfamily protein [Knoellia remsis]|uniref:Thioesterase superfamily protein n=1 Tax=Knoellia remsis TaxID=407159 RepID=A0A2T0UNN7_9MICO|nr:thioesterase family protein [Knoellia remsis]PRY59488.1 thioesterase superfamily protein [Knoellia remsis]